MEKVKNSLLCVIVLLLSACYNHGPVSPDAWDLTERQIDSLSFFTTHHYSQNYNFVVKARQMPISDEAGSQAFDTLYVSKGDPLVVADIKTISSDTIDSVWVKVARDQMTQGWIRESEMLPCVSPNDPISQFIDFFSDTHLLLFLALLVVVVVAYGLRRLMRHNARIVHFNDIDSFYPTLLCILIASSATLYASIQMFSPESWRHFYYHPSLNPFSLPWFLALFIASVWAILIVGVATIDDVVHRLEPSEGLLYLCGLAGVCAVDYVLFSITTLYYIGFLFLVVYIIFALWRYFRYSHYRYVCGNCGARMHRKGICPKCGVENV